MEKQKTYKSYYINNYTLHTQNKIKALKELLKANNENKQDFDTWYYKESMTETQYNYFKNGDFKKLKTLLLKQIPKEGKKLQEEKEKALQNYNKIAEKKDIKSITLDINWSSGRRSMGAYQTKASGWVFYKDGSSEFYETGYTGGCGYDKQSTSASEFFNKLCKIVLLKHYTKIQKDTEKHYHFYAGEDGYFQYGVGINSYITFFKNCGYKVKEIYHKNEDITLLITK